MSFGIKCGSGSCVRFSLGCSLSFSISGPLKHCPKSKAEGWCERGTTGAVFMRGQPVSLCSAADSVA